MLALPLLALVATRLVADLAIAQAMGLTAAAAGAAVCLAALCGGERLQDRHRRSWLLITVAVAAWTVGQVLISVRPIAPIAAVSEIIIANLGYAVFVPVLLLGLLLVVPRSPEPGSLPRLALDSMIALFSLATLTWLVGIEPVLRLDPPRAAVAAVILHACGNVSLVMVTLLGGLWIGNRPITPEFAALATGVAVFAVADTLSLHAWAAGLALPNAVGNGLLTVGFVLLGVAALAERRRAAGPDGVPRIAETTDREPLWRTVLPYPLALLVIGLVGWQQLADGLDNARAGVMATSLTVLAVTILRQGMAVRDARRLTDTLTEQVDRDPLTGLLNHRKGQERITRELAHGLEWGHPLAIALIDVDDFKQVNDTFGHLVGDQVLRRLADVLLKSCRGTDTAARFAGDEFLLILPGADAAAARAVGQRVLRQIRATQTEQPSGEPPISLSIGIAVTNRYVRTSEQILAIADAAMYDAKESGKNGAVVVDADTLVEAPRVTGAALGSASDSRRDLALQALMP